MKEKLWTKSYIGILVTNFFLMLTFYLLMVTISIFAVNEFNATQSQAGLASSIFVIGALVGRVIGGKYIDRLGRKKLLMAGLIIMVVSAALYFGVHSFGMLIANRLLHGFAFGLAGTVLGTVVAQVIPKARKGEGIGYFALSMTLATAIGPFVGMFIQQHFQFSMIFVFCLTCIAVALVLSFFIEVQEITLTEEQKAEDLRIQTEKMNIVAQLAAGIAHEIRNPLTSLKGFVQLFRTDTVPRKEHLDVMENELERINAISGEFLTLAKPYHLDFSPIDLQELLKNVVDILFNEAQKHSVSIGTNFPKEKITIQGVGRELKKLFLNLIKNAIEAMPDGGKITIYLMNRDGYAEIQIQDNGIGMTEEQVKRLGEPFFTTKETGTGLGLVVSYNVIHTHHGEINVKSQLNEGTTFTVRLPISG